MKLRVPLKRGVFPEMEMQAAMREQSPVQAGENAEDWEMRALKNYGDVNVSLPSK